MQYDINLTVNITQQYQLLHYHKMPHKKHEAYRHLMFQLRKFMHDKHN